VPVNLCKARLLQLFLDLLFGVLIRAEDLDNYKHGVVNIETNHDSCPNLVLLRKKDCVSVHDVDVSNYYF
jgi:hypothetical protein